LNEDIEISAAESSYKCLLKIWVTRLYINVAATLYLNPKIRLATESLFQTTNLCDRKSLRIGTLNAIIKAGTHHRGIAKEEIFALI
jgi:hypothetical protein